MQEFLITWVLIASTVLVFMGLFYILNSINNNIDFSPVFRYINHKIAKFFEVKNV